MLQHTDEQPVNFGAAAGGTALFVAPQFVTAVRFVAHRELRLMLRGRLSRAIFALLLVLAMLPPLLVSLRAGSLGLAPFSETVALALAFGEVALPLIGLLVGADVIAGESEDGTLVPLVALPVSRASCFAGKFIGRALVLIAAYLAAFASAVLAIAALGGTQGWQDYAAVVVAGLLLCLVCAGVGVAMGRPGRGRARAFGTAMVAWIVMVFVLDAAILGAVVALAPAPPEEVGSHGYGEMAAQREMMKLHELDDSQDNEHRGAVAAGSPRQLAQWLMALDPVDLFRFTVLSSAPALHERAKVGLGENDPGLLLLIAAWIAWFIFPLGLALRHFRRADLH
jgi:ABC-type transport system involved in multi-copper enzyme maturation permease subunit